MLKTNQDKYTYIKYAIDDLSDRVTQAKDISKNETQYFDAKKILGPFYTNFCHGKMYNEFTDLDGFLKDTKDYIRHSISRGFYPPEWKKHIETFVDLSCGPEEEFAALVESVRSAARKPTTIAETTYVDEAIESVTVDLKRLTKIAAENPEAIEIINGLVSQELQLGEVYEYSFPRVVDELVSARYESFVDDMHDFLLGQGAEIEREYVEEQYAYDQSLMYAVEDAEGQVVGYIYDINMENGNHDEDYQKGYAIISAQGEVLVEEIKSTIDY